MGSFNGHLLPSLVCLYVGLRCLYLVLAQFQESRNRKVANLKDSPHHLESYAWCPRTASGGSPKETWIKLTFCIVGIIGETFTAFNHDWVFVNYGNTQHITIFTFYAIAVATEGIIGYRRPMTNDILPYGSDYLTLAMAIFVELLLFAHHLHGRPPLDILVHQLHIVTVILCLSATLVEWQHRDSHLAVIFKGWAWFVHGSWLLQIGFILYNPLPGATPWGEHDHDQMMIVTVLYCAHLALGVLVVVLIGWWHYRPVKDCETQNKNYDNVPYTQLSMAVKSDE